MTRIIIIPFRVKICGCQVCCSSAYKLQGQHAKKVVSDSLGLVDFAVRLENSVFNLPNEQVTFFLRNSNNRRTVKSILLVKKFLGLVEMMSGLLNASFSLPEQQAVKMIFFAPCRGVTELNHKNKGNYSETPLTATSVIQSPCYYGHFLWPPSKIAIHFLCKKTLINMVTH